MTINAVAFWQWWILAMVTINTGINMIVFFKHRFKGKDKNV